MAALRGEPADGEEVTGNGSGGAAVALEALLGSLTTLRNVVEFATRPGDPARETLRFRDSSAIPCLHNGRICRVRVFHPREQFLNAPQTRLKCN